MCTVLEDGAKRMFRIDWGSQMWVELKYNMKNAMKAYKPIIV